MDSNNDSFDKNFLWGEIPQVADTESGIAALEREQIMKPRPLDVEGPLLHQPSSRHHPPTNEVQQSELFQMDPRVIHTIRLIMHIRKVRAAIAALQQDVKPDLDPAAVAVGPIPEYDGPPQSDRSHQKYFTEEDYQSDFVRGVGNPPPPIDDVTCRRLLKRSTATICAHLSFETAPESVLDTLTDVCQEFFIQFTKHLGAAADRRGIYGSDGFPDIVERAFHEMGMGSMTCLHDFYQQRIIVYHEKMKQQCEALMAEYNALRKQPAAAVKQQPPQSPSGGDTLHVIRIKEEPSTEIQFPLLDENDEVNETEQLLNIESLGTFEITVEHESSTGLTTEVETKWSHAGKGGGEAKLKQSTSTEEGPDNPSSIQEVARTPQSNIPKTPQSSVPRTPQSNIPPTPQDGAAPTPRDYSSQEDNVIQEPGSISNMDIFSPSVPTPSKPKKKKRT